MEARLQKWGNSFGIRIPITLLKELHLKENEILKLEKEEDRIVISKSKTEKISLAKRFETYHGKNLAKEFEWDEAKGKEIW